MKKTFVSRLSRGFTLIELLVVIAIIGILAAMVITNLRTSRAKARDASAVTSMSSARAEAESYYSTFDQDYTGLCASDTFTTLLTAAENATEQTAECDDTFQSGQGYWAYIGLLATLDNSGTPTEIFCIDSTGFSGRMVSLAPLGTETCQLP
ncbi:MAG: type II secretion system protein [Candidatus Pacebacteria bacterium]|nr:type II secretion system protein [Candidatus Paceibacterota bacterium]